MVKFEIILTSKNLYDTIQYTGLINKELNMMRIIEIETLYFTDYNIKHLFAMSQTWNNKKVFTMSKRKTSGFLYLKDCNVTLNLKNGETLNAKQGSIIYLPQNSDYILTFYSCNEETAKTQLIEFELFDNNSAFSVAESPILICDKNNNFYSDIFDEAISIYEKPFLCYGKFKALIFSLITDITERKKHEITIEKKS